MNKIFKVIWSKTKNCYVVASELAKSHTKSPRSGIFSRTLVAGVLACICTFGATVPSYASIAQGDTNPVTGGDVWQYLHDWTIGIGYDSNPGYSSVSIGPESSAGYDGTAVGPNANSGGYSVAVGYNTSAANESIVVGNESVAGQHSVSIGISTGYQNLQSTPIAAPNSVSIGYQSTSYDSSVSVGYQTNAAENAVAIGKGSVANNSGAIAIGQDVSAKGYESVSFGNDSKSNAEHSIAIGKSSVAGWSNQDGTTLNAPSNAVAIGTTARAIQNSSTALGWGAIAGAEDAIAIGTNALVGDSSTTDFNSLSGEGSIAIGREASATGLNSVAIGRFSKTTEDNVVSVGDTNKERRITNVSAGINATDAVNVGQLNEAIAGASGGSEIHGVGINGITASDSNYNGGGATGSRSIAIGNEVEANGMSSIAIGDIVSFHDNAKSAIGIGNSVESSWQSVVIGSNSTSRESETVVLGYYNTTDANSSVVIGDENYIGTDSDYSVAIGHNVVVGDTANGSENLENVVAIGNGVTVKDDSYNTIAIGNSAVENNAFGSVALNGTIFENSHSGVAINGNIGENSVGSIAINGQIYDNVTSSIAIGGSVSEDVSDSVALGSGSVATEDNVVSIGNNALKRQIKYVAAGTDDTDAVNVSQLNDAIAGIGSGGTHYLGINTTSTTDANYNGDTAVGLNSISIGRAGFDTGAIDKVAGALKENSISIGNGTTAGGVSAIAIGTGAIGGKNSSVAKDYSIAIGRDAKASIDRYANPVWTSGSGAVLASNKKGSAIALGSEAEAENMNSIAIGYDTSSKGTNSIMIGMTGRANGADSIGIGTSVQADASNSVSIGANSASRTSGGVSIGSGAINNGGVAIGNEAYAGSVGIVSFGHKVGDPAKSGTYSSAKTVRVINVADGVETHDVSTVNQTAHSIDLVDGSLVLKSVLDEELASVDVSQIGGTSYTAGNHISIGNDSSISAVIDGTVSSGNTGLVNGGQVYDAIQTIRPNVYIAGNGIVINGDDNSVSVKNVIMYDSDAQDTATLNGTRGTKLTNLKVGSLANGSTDAVVGHQLWQTNENIRGFAQDIQTNSTNITNLTTSVTNALSSVSAISTTVDAINNVKADASLNNLTDTGRQVIASAAANAVQEYLATNGGNGGSAGNGLLGGSSSTLSASAPRVMGFGLMANPMNNDNDDIVTNNDDLSDNGDNTISQAVQDALDTKVEISDFNTALDLKADKDSVYSKDEVDIKFDTKADISYVDNQLGSKADLSYVDAEFEKKADKDSVYTKDEADALLDAKADKEMLDEKANKDASNIEVEDWAKVLGIGEVAEGNNNLVNGGTVYSALQDVKGNDLMAVDNNAIRIGGNAKYDDVRTIDVSTASGEGRVITGVVVNPEDATSVANVGYVNAVGENIVAGVTEGFRRVDDKISDVGANAAAMSALMPAGDDADKKWSLSAAVGHYDSSTAGAVGLFYKPSDNVILNVRGTVGSDENMLAGGVSVALDKGSTPGISKAQMVKTINAQAEKIAQQDQRMQQQEQEIVQLKAVVSELVKGQNKK